MYAAVSNVEMESYPDLWRKGNYRVDLTAELCADIDSVDAALQQSGYNLIDANQRGRSYIHNSDSSHTAELDEVEGPEPYVKLVLRNGDLDEAEIAEAESYVNNMFDRIYQLSCEQYNKDYYNAGLDWPSEPV